MAREIAFETNSMRLARKNRREVVGALAVGIPVVVLGLIFFLASGYVPTVGISNAMKGTGFLIYSLGLLVVIPAILVWLIP